MEDWETGYSYGILGSARLGSVALLPARWDIWNIRMPKRIYVKAALRIHTLCAKTVAELLFKPTERGIKNQHSRSRGAWPKRVELSL